MNGVERGSANGDWSAGDLARENTAAGSLPLHREFTRAVTVF
jgi:hypothetical protein